MAVAHPLDWIRQIESSLLELEEKPQFGLPTPFDWGRFEKRLQHLFEKPDLKILHTIHGWKTPDQLFHGFGQTFLPLTIEWPTLGSSAFFITNQQNLKQLMADLFNSEECAAFFFDQDHVKGFYKYFAVEIFHALEEEKLGSPLSPCLGEEPEKIREKVGEESCFVIDLALSFNDKNFWGRLLLPESFRRDWKKHFAQLGPPPLSEEMQKKVMVDVGLEVAYSHLSLQEWKRVKKGDFVLLDHCSYDPVEHKGGIVLTLQRKPIFRGRFKEGGIKITNYPLYEEVSMEDEPMSPEDEEEEDEDLYGDLSDEEEELGEEEQEEIPEEPSPIPTTPVPSEEAPPISPEKLPVHLTVEVGRIRMTANELMNLAPGNLLELHVSPEQGVDLVINGKKVGRGELIRMGDVLGVRILSL